jgi:hypothetical protein
MKAFPDNLHSLSAMQEVLTSASNLIFSEDEKIKKTMRTTTSKGPFVVLFFACYTREKPKYVV